jgi:hypothetical protein
MPIFFGLLWREKVYSVKENSLVNNRAGKNFQASFSPSLLLSSPLLTFYLLGVFYTIYYFLVLKKEASNSCMQSAQLLIIKKGI